MVNLNKINRRVKTLEDSKKSVDVKRAFKILEAFEEGLMDKDTAINILDNEKPPFTDMVKVLIDSSYYSDYEKKLKDKNTF